MARVPTPSSVFIGGIRRLFTEGLEQASGRELDILFVGKRAYKTVAEKTLRRLHEIGYSHIEKFLPVLTLQTACPGLQNPCQGPNGQDAIDDLYGIDCYLIAKKVY